MHSPGSCPGSADLKTATVCGRCGEGKRGRLADLHRFDSRTGVWRQLPSSNNVVVRGQPCRRHASASRHMQLPHSFDQSQQRNPSMKRVGHLRAAKGGLWEVM